MTNTSFERLNVGGKTNNSHRMCLSYRIECVASMLLLMKDRKIHAYVEQRDCPKNCQKDQKKLWTASVWALLSCLLSGRCDFENFFLFSISQKKK